MRSCLPWWHLMVKEIIPKKAVSLFSLGCGSLGSWVWRLHSALLSICPRPSRRAASPHVALDDVDPSFLCLPLLRCPRTSASKIRLTQPSFSRRCACPYHFSLASHTLSVMHATPRMRRMSSFLFLSLNVKPRIHLNILTLVLSKLSSSRLLNVHASES